MSMQIFGELIRIRQWTKNLFVLAPLVFSSSFFDPERIVESGIAFFIFSIASSSVYILNDMVDLPNDRLHPLKKQRPLARGAVSTLVAGTTAFFLATGALSSSFLLPRFFSAALICYLLLNVFYTFWLKRVFLLDMFSVAFGFVLRVVAGATAISVLLTPWVLGATFFLALFITATKRFLEYSMVDKENRRLVLSFYTPDFLKQVMLVSLFLTLAVYILYVFLEIRSLIFLPTVLPVAYVLLRLLWLVDAGEVKTDNPTDIFFQDTQLQFAVIIFVVWVITSFSPHVTDYANLFFLPK